VAPAAQQTRTLYYPLEGGIDAVTPPLDVAPGKALTMVNFEPYMGGGYRRIAGFEVFDGRPRPSDASFVGLLLSSGPPAVFTAVTGATSGATGVICGAGGGAGNYIGVTKVVGTFLNGETLNGGGSRTIVAAPILLDAPTVAFKEAWLLTAETIYRNDITTVPGTGTVRGAWRRNQYPYAFRDNGGVGQMYVGDSAGWTTGLHVMGKYVFFTAGAATGPFLEGETINGQTSGATGVVHRVILHSGGWAGTAVGYVVFSATTGTFQAAENLRRGVTVIAVCSGAQTTFAFPVGGTYQFINHNFYGGAGNLRTYGCNGVGPAFEISEGNVVSPILLPVTPLGNQPVNNTPFLIAEHREHLFLAYPGGLVQHSSPGVPLQFNGFLSAGAFGMGDEMTGLNSVVGGVLIITTANKANGLYGKTVADWEMKPISERTGGKLYSTQKLDTVYGLGPLGITSINRTDAFGDFANATVSQLVQPIVDALRQHVTASTVVRKSNQYRLYFDDGSVLVMYVPVGSVEASRGGSGQARVIEFGYLLYDRVVRKVYNTEDENGVERIYFTSDDGYVYEDQGSKNFNGNEIVAYLRTAYNHVGSPAYRKKFRRADVELQAQQALSLQFYADLSYGSPETPTTLATTTVFGGGGYWDVSNWDSFVWDGQPISTARAELGGTGTNIGFLIYHHSATVLPFVLQGITLHYDMRRLQR
jgi:hypothetical protein